MKRLNFFLLLKLIAYVYSGAFYQFLPKYSFDFRNPNTSSAISSYILKGDATKGKDSFKLTSSQANSYGSIQTSKPLNVSQFEFQLSFKINAKYTRGSVLGIWFYTEKTEMPTGKTFFGFTNQFKGFGLLIHTKAELREDLTNLRFRLLFNENGTDLEPFDLNELEKGSSCTEFLSKRHIKVTISTAEAFTRVNFDNINSFINNCGHSFVNLVNKKNYNIALTSFNGEFNHTVFEDQIEITKLSMFNTLYRDSRKILGLPDLPVKEYDYQLNQPIREKAKDKKELTMNDLSTIINKCSVDALKLKEQMKKELNVTFLSMAIPFLADNINYLVEVLNKTEPLIADAEEQELFSFKIKIIEKEYMLIVENWMAIRANATHQPELYNKIQHSLVQIHNDLAGIEKMQFFEGDKLEMDITNLKTVLSNKEGSLNIVIYVVIGVLVLVITVLVFQIFRKTTKEKAN